MRPAGCAGSDRDGSDPLTGVTGHRLDQGGVTSGMLLTRSGNLGLVTGAGVMVAMFALATRPGDIAITVAGF